MNEGWASYWHREILNALELPQELHLEFLVRHNQVVRPHPGGLNPYHLGLKVWDDIKRRTTTRRPRSCASTAPPTQPAATRCSRPARPIATSRSSAAS